MQPHDDAKPAQQHFSKRRGAHAPRLSPYRRAGGPLLVLALMVLACSCPWLGAGSASPKVALATRTPWPTFTPTSAPAPPPPSSAGPPTASPTLPAPATPAPVALTSPDEPTATPSPLPAPQAAAPLAGDTPLPPTAAATQAPTPTSVPTFTPTSAPSPTPTSALPPTPTSPPAPEITSGVDTPGWSLAGVRFSRDEYQMGLLVYGDLVNNTGSPQALSLITGAFYDGEGQMISDQARIYDYWPAVQVIPPGARLPFELMVEGVQHAENYVLSVEAAPSGASPHEDFEFGDVNQHNAEDQYCIVGSLQGPGQSLQAYLVIAAILYDEQGNVVNFGSYYQPYLEGGQNLDFDICISPPTQDVAHYELRAWGL